MKQTQLVSMAPFTTSSSGKTTKKRRVSPMMCIVSNTSTTKKSEKEDLLHDLNTQILADLKAVPAIITRIVMEENYDQNHLQLPSSGIMKAKNMHQVQATRSWVEIFATYSLPLSRAWLQYSVSLLSLS